MTVPWHKNMLACYPALIARLQQIEGIKSVRHADDIGDLQDRQVPLDGALYVIFDAFVPQQAADGGRNQFVEIGFSLVLAKRKYRPSESLYLTGGVGETLTAIARAMQGFAPQDDDGNDLTLTPFTQSAALAISYDSRGFGLFPLRFITQVAILATKH